ncbi:hypothetical protein Rhe02_02980 [Rhizocola hellebori]|uniref:Lantibiotic dehydratase n=2 Tax=Rhizocola hellebori TaxID=1392758 RepID=A0A8J3VD78_9ACTN|nr:hypothetical protein Rhe02_02980 [Rhizocola hellebori]
MVRTPLLPVEAAMDLLTDRDAALDRLVAMPEVRRALLLSSPALFDAVERGPSRDERTRSALLRYLMRMATRPTPFGASAGVALVSFGKETTVQHAGESMRTRSRLDLEWLAGLIQSLEENPDVRRRLRLRTHPAAWRRGGRVVLAERAPRIGASREQVSVRATEVVLRTLEAASQPIVYADLVDRVSLTAPGATSEQAAALIDALWRNTLLVSDLWPPLTCPDPASYLVERLDGISESGETAHRLRALVTAATALDAGGVDATVGGHRQVVQMARALSPHAADRPLMTDSRITLRGDRISAVVGAEAARAASLLLSMTPLPDGPSWLAAWRRAFVARYGMDRTVPVMEALDPATGIGPPPPGSPVAQVSAGVAARREAALVHLAAGALAAGSVEVNLDETVLGQLRTWSPSSTAPPSVDVNVFVAATSAAAIDSGDFEIVVGPNTGARRAGKGLGRFVTLLGAGGRGLAERCAAVLPQGRLPVELVYLPSNVRSANVAVRPSLVRREICLAVAPGVADEQVIPIDQVQVAVRDGRLVLRWGAQDADLHVVSSHMLNNLQAPAFCRFLADVGDDGVAQLAPFDWGTAARFPRLPRVRCGKTILRPAQWRITAHALNTELAAAEKRHFGTAFARWRATWSVPQHVYITAADNRLLVNLDDGAHVEILRREASRALRTANQLRLEEVYPPLDRAWLAGPKGHYLAELTVPLVTEAPEPASAPEPALTVPKLPEPGGHTALRPALSATAYRQSPAGRWLCAHLLLPADAIDDAVAGQIGRFAESMRAAGHARSWFFVRYADPDSHLRLRFLGDSNKLHARVLPALAATADALIREGICAGWSIEPYDREVERYGGNEAMELTEEVFAADSRACAELLAAIQARRTPLDRLTLAVLSIDDLLSSFGLDVQQRLGWCRALVVSRQAAGAAFRDSKATLRRLLGVPGEAAQIAGGAVVSALDRRHGALSPSAGRLAELEAAGRLSRPLPHIQRALVHMHCNRLFGIDRDPENQALGLVLRTLESLERAPVRLTETTTVHIAHTGDSNAEYAGQVQVGRG